MDKRKDTKVMLLIVLATTLLGQVNAKPFGTDFRISLGIIVLSVLLLRFNNISIMKTCLLTGISINLFRVILEAVPGDESISALLLKHYPAVVFYLFFAAFLILLNYRETISKPLVCIMIIALSDIGANTIEIILRGDFKTVAPEVMSVSVVLTGTIRAVISYLLFLSEKFYTLLIINREQRQKYKEFVMMRANIKSEIFFMKKSMDDIEHSMKESFDLYRYLNKKQDVYNEDDINMMKNRVLGISKNIHEIKKDYNRIIAGIGNLIPDVGYTQFKTSDEIFEILDDVTGKYIHKTGKNIQFSIQSNVSFKIYFYSPLLSILNNLIVNAIDAIRHEGWVKIEVHMSEDYVTFYVMDNGAGIKSKNIEAIFTPGFSTKFDEKTGKMSTGIGLTHVKQIVEQSLKGDIHVKSVENHFTQFIIKLDKNILTGGTYE